MRGLCHPRTPLLTLAIGGVVLIRLCGFNTTLGANVGVNAFAGIAVSCAAVARSAALGPRATSAVPEEMLPYLARTDWRIPSSLP